MLYSGAVNHIIRSWNFLATMAAFSLAISACRTTPTPAPGEVGLQLPAQLQGKAVVLAPTDADYARAEAGDAVKPAGEGGVSEVMVVKLTSDVTVWRMWSGPEKKNASGLTNRMGQWWAYDAPRGTRSEYRGRYEICRTWNDLTWMAACTMKAGAVVAIGPGNSVSPETCGDAAGSETYAANTTDWQVYVAKAWSRPTELECPAETSDYAADCKNIAQPATEGMSCDGE